jgi:hypothetical protein
VKAYVLVQTTANQGSIAEQLRGIRGVVEAADLSGPFDAIALAASDSVRSLTDQIVEDVRRLPGVIRVLTAPLVTTPGRALDPGNSTAA